MQMEAAITCPSPASTGVAASTYTSALNILAAAQCLITEPWPSNAKVSDKDKFDFIIIGAGTAGSILANRLTENKNWTVLLIEAGRDPPEESIIPYLAGTLWNSKYDWNYTCVNDTKIGQGLLNGPTYWPRGKMLGGSGSSNVMIHLRGIDSDYQKWYDAGNKEWSLATVKKYFRKAENLQDPKLLSDPKIRSSYGTDGPLPINLFNSTTRATSKKVLSAYDEIGIKNVPDLNAAHLMGSGIFTATVANGQRTSTATGYLNPVKTRTNLKIIKNTMVNKILIDKSTKLAYGVETESNGKKSKFQAKYEVIISAGSVNTPKLLMLSGVGPKKVLKKHKIDVIVDASGVGQNLQDQTIVPVTIFGDDPKASNTLDDAVEILRYLSDRTGTMADILFSDISAFYPLKKSDNDPHFQNLMSIYRVNASAALQQLRGYKPSVAESLIEHLSKKAMYLFQVIVLRPRSRGYITLRSSDPKKSPLIYPNYFKDKKDLDDVITGIKILTKILDTKYFKSINAKLVRMNYEPCDDYDLDSKDYWRCVALNFVTTVYHPIGTAKMGKDKAAVVDSRLKVHGITGLRVVDASVMPTMPSCNTNAPTVMIAERAADLIKDDLDDEDYVATIREGKDALISKG